MKVTLEEIYIYGSGNNSASTLTVVGGASGQSASYFNVKLER